MATHQSCLCFHRFVAPPPDKYPCRATDLTPPPRTGIAITQLFRLNSTSATTSQDAHEVLKQVGKPLGATFLAIAVLVLMIGTNRYVSVPEGGVGELEGLKGCVQIL